MDVLLVAASSKIYHGKIRDILLNLGVFRGLFATIVAKVVAKIAGRSYVGHGFSGHGLGTP